MPTLSLCMIVKNEEEVLARCLGSVNGLADELIIVDTGSEDNTIEIAQTFDAKVFHFEWIDDFAAARNYSFEQATGDYILWLDADDVLLPDNLAKLQALKPQLDKDVYYLPYDYQQDAQGRSMSTLFRERIIRRGANIQWHYPIHECMIIATDHQTQQCDITITHQRNDAGRAADQNRNIRILEKAVTSDKHKNEPRIHYYLAKEYQDHGMVEQAIPRYQHFLEMPTGWLEDRICAFHRLGACCLEQAKQLEGTAKRDMIQRARTAARRSIHLDNRWAEPYYVLGNVAFELEDHEEAVLWYKKCLIPFPEVWSPLNHFSYTIGPLVQLVLCYDRLGEHHLAQDYNNQALELRPNDAGLLHNKKYFEEVLGSNNTAPTPTPQHTSTLKVGWQGKGATLDFPPHRIRVVMPQQWLQERGYASTLANRFEAFDTVIFANNFQKISHQEMKAAKARGQRVILNLCEDLFDHHMDYYENLIALADEVVCCSHALAKKVQAHHPVVHIIQDAFEADTGKNVVYANKLKPKVAWMGMGGNEAHAEKLRAMIEEAGYELVTIHNREDASVKWSLDSWEEELLKCDVAIAPLKVTRTPSKSNNKVTTYMALGLPVIASPLDAYTRIIEHGVNGFIARKKKDWAKYLKQLKDPALRKRIGLAGKTAALNFHPDVIGRQWEQLLFSPTGQQSTATIEVREQPLIVINTGFAYEPWTGKNRFEGGIGGSETAAACLGEQFHLKGNKVVLFGNCTGMEGEYRGVDYQHIDRFETFAAQHQMDVLIMSRYVQFLHTPMKAHQKYLWIHDTHALSSSDNREEELRQLAAGLDKVVCLTPFHKQFFAQTYGLDERKITIKGNGIELDRFKQKVKKVPHQFIYSSSPDRGLDTLLYLFRFIKAQLPDATLKVYYGFENWNKSIEAHGNKEQKALRDRIMADLEQPGVTYYGRIGQKELAKAYLESDIWFYPVNFTETYCITALEAQMAKVACICTDLGGLHDTVGERGILLSGNPYTKAYREQALETVLSLAQDKKRKKALVNQAHQWAKQQTWKNRAKEWLGMFTPR